MIKGHSHEIISENIRKMVKDGMPIKQAIAESMAHAHASKMSDGGVIHSENAELGDIGGGEDGFSGEAVYEKRFSNDDGLSDGIDNREEFSREPLKEDVMAAIMEKKSKRKYGM